MVAPATTAPVAVEPAGAADFTLEGTKALDDDAAAEEAFADAFTLDAREAAAVEATKAELALVEVAAVPEGKFVDT